ncbi:MAG: AMP phosphorylase [Candidatus Methanomethylophilaceae archaeon]|nr:AMP phosphorylase [Candidatus Methanomethylophilaceae archaeon]
MTFKVRRGDLVSADPQVLLNPEDAASLGLKIGDRVRIMGKKEWVSLFGMTSKIHKGVVAIPTGLADKYRLADGDDVEIEHSPKPESVSFIRKKMDGKKLTESEIYEIIQDILDSKLSDIEVSAWLTALHTVGMDIEEIASHARAMVDTGDRLEFGGRPVFDFHSIGGVPGNKITPIVVSIVAAAGLMIPKTSSRAISSACGTSDFVETFCNVDIPADDVRRIAMETGGLFSWGGSMNLAPVDDLVIKVENPLGINPRAQMLASILSKKIAIGANCLLIDIPTGAGTKVPDMDTAHAYVRDFTDLGRLLGINIKCAITYAGQPVGYAIGPNLEARECIRVLEGDDHPKSVIEKSCELAGMLLEMGGIPNGAQRAKEILQSGEAMKKFREIVAAQGGSYDVSSKDLKPGKYHADIYAVKTGYINSVNNKAIVGIAKAAGSPNDKGAGIILVKKQGQHVDAGDVVYKIYADSEAKCNRAKELAIRYAPFGIEGMVIERD